LRTVGPPRKQVDQSSYLALKIASVNKALDGCETSIDGSKPLTMLGIRKPEQYRPRRPRFELLTNRMPIFQQNFTFQKTNKLEYPSRLGYG
jgi:hypothetical protein